MTEQLVARVPIAEAPADPEAFFEFAERRIWGDGLPLVPPTPDRVKSFLAAAGRAPHEVVGVLDPRGGAATVEYIAINAVMAGCRPEYLPVVIAAVEAITDPVFDLHSVQVDVNAATVVVVVNGPVRQRIGMNALGNCLGGGNRANVTIGRAVRLVMMNIGGSRPPDSDVAIHGQPGKISMCFAEDEEGTPWEPLSVERGFAPSQSTVTVAAVTGTQNVLTGVHDPDAMLTLIADGICTMGSNTVLLGGRAGQGGLGGGPVVSFSRGLARLLDRDGLTKQDVKARIFERARKPASLMPMTLNPVRIEQVIRVDGEVHALRDPDQVVLVVAGYDSPNHTCLMPNYCVNGVVTRAVAE
jgi:hypothetical protein